MRGGGPGFNDGTAVPMEPQPHQYEPNTVNWGGRQSSVPSNFPGAKVETMPEAPGIAGRPMANPIVETFSAAKKG